MRAELPYQAFHGLINFDDLQFAFGDTYETINSLYEQLQGLYGWNFLYWLQRGRAEVYFDNFDRGENFLRQSLGIRDNYQAWHYMGVLFLKRAYCEVDAVTAFGFAKEGERFLREQIAGRGAQDPYPAAALVEHKMRYLSKHGSPRLVEELDELHRLAKEAA